MAHAESESGIRVHLADKTIWQKFYPKTEMMVTKPGRIIFPHLEYKIKGLQEQSLYQICLYIERINNKKYQYMGGKWNELGKGEPALPIRYKEHPHGARPGSHWMKNTVSFAHLKLTNDQDNCDKKLIAVQSMHRFRPVIRIKRVDEDHAEDFRINLTEFMAVTAYQDSEVVKQKITHNKFASGFRSGKKRNAEEQGATGGQPMHSFTLGAHLQAPNQFFPAYPANNFFLNPQNPQNPPNRLSISPGSDISTPGTVTPSMKEERFDTPSPTVFDQNGFPQYPQSSSSPFSM